MTAPNRSPHADPLDPVARRATDQIDPYALIERAERLLNSEPHDAVVFALRAQSVARARTADSLMARAHFVAGAALMQVGDWSGAIRQLSQAEHVYRAQHDVAAQCKVIIQLAAACCELGEYGDALDGFAQAQKLARQNSDTVAARRALVQQSAVHTMLGDFEAARDSLRSALELPSGSAADEGLVVFQFGQVDANEGLRAALAGDATTVAKCMADAEEHFEVALELLAGTIGSRERDQRAHATRRRALLARQVQGRAGGSARRGRGGRAGGLQVARSAGATRVRLPARRRGPRAGRARHPRTGDDAGRGTRRPAAAGRHVRTAVGAVRSARASSSRR